MAEAKNYLDPKVLGRVSSLELRARMVVEGLITGMHRSPFYGFSVEFADYRKYTFGDELKHLDWKVWGRSDRYYIKRYEQETNLVSHLMLDSSASMRYRGDTAGMSKYDYGATVAAALAFLLTRQRDPVSLSLFDSEIRRQIPSSSQSIQVRTMADAMAAAPPERKTEVAGIFHRMAEEIRRRGLIVLISDLFCPVDDLIAGLNHFRHKRHEVLVMHVLDRDEVAFPFDDNTLFRGLEIPAELLVDPRALRDAYLQVFNEFVRRVRRECTAKRVDYVQLVTDEPLDASLSAYLHAREKITGAKRGVA